MPFTKITDADRKGKGNTGRPDTPNLSTSDMQKVMDELPNMAIDGLNAHIDEITSSTAAGSVGAKPPTGIAADSNVQSILDAMELENSKNTGNNHSHSNKSVLDEITAPYTTEEKASVADYAAKVTNIDDAILKRHDHDNKSILDMFTSALKAGYDNLVTLFTGITGTENTVTNEETKLVTGAAVAAYVQKMGGGDMTKAVYDTDEDGTVDNSEKLGGQEPGYYADKTSVTAIQTSVNDSLSKEQIYRILTVGLEDGTTVINGKVITTTATDGRKTITTISDSSIVTVLYDKSGSIVATGTTTFAAGVPTTIIT